MPRYSLVGCSGCDALKIVDGTPKTTTCSNCNARLKFRKLKRFYESDDTAKVSQAKAVLLARRAGEEDEILELIEAGALDEDIAEAVSDDEYLIARGVDPKKVDEASDISPKRTPSRDEQVSLAIEQLEHPTKSNIAEYVFEMYGVPTDRTEKFVDGLYLNGDLSRNADGEYRQL